ATLRSRCAWFPPRPIDTARHAAARARVAMPAIVCARAALPPTCTTAEVPRYGTPCTRSEHALFLRVFSTISDGIRVRNSCHSPPFRMFQRRTRDYNGRVTHSSNFSRHSHLAVTADLESRLLSLGRPRLFAAWRRNRNVTSLLLGTRTPPAAAGTGRGADYAGRRDRRAGRQKVRQAVRRA